MGRHILNQKTVDVARQGEANLLRNFLLAKYGGVWTDASSFSWKPLDEIQDHWSERNYFVPLVPQFDRAVDNWFTVSKARDETMVKWLAYTKRYLFKPRT